MKDVQLGEVIATRKLTLDGGTEVTVHVGRPCSPPEWNSNFYCPYQIIGLGSERVRRVGGVDSMQALVLALEAIGADFYAYNKLQANKISWFDQSDLGFPIPDFAIDLGSE